MKSWSDTECEEIVTLAGWCLVLQPVYVKKYVKWKHEGEVCVDVRLLVFLDWRATSWRWRGRSRNVYQSTCRRWFFVCFYLFSTLGCVCVCEKWCGVAYTFYSLFFLFLLLLLFFISLSPITVIFPKILYISRPHRYASIWLIAIDVAWSVCLLDTTVSHAKTDKLIKMPFGLC